MDIVKFWSDVTAQWQAEQKCGLCWEFEAPYIEALSHSIQNVNRDEIGDEKCCVSVIYTTPQISETQGIHPLTQFPIREGRDYSFTIHFVKRGDLGTNNYTEIKGHPVSESRHETTYNPILKCLEDKRLYELFCEYVGKKIDVPVWRLQPSHAYLDNNYFGWKLTATFREEI